MGRGQELLDAAREGDRKTVEKILGQITKRSGPFTSLRRGAGVNVQDDNGYTPLHHACLHGRKEIVRLLLAADASPCVVDKKGATPLHLAAFKGDSDVVAMLLAHNNPPVNIDQLTSDHETALLIAAHFGYVDVVAQLMAKGADVTIENNNGESALDLAAQYGRLETVQHLLRVRPELVDQYYLPPYKQWIFASTPLHRASKHGRKEVVAALIKAGVDPNVRTANGTALHEAVCFGKHSVVRILLDNGADIDARDSQGKTVYDLLADYSEEATRRVRRALKDYETRRNQRSAYESDDDLLPPFPVPGPDHSPTGYHHSNIMKAPETQKNTNINKSLMSPSSSSLIKNHPQSFVKKLASKCLGLKAKFNSAPNISNSHGPELAVDVKNKGADHKLTNTLLIGNSKFFNKILSKKEESGEINCNDEFDTISLDRITTLNRDSVVNKSNRSCPGFKTSLPNISEHNELSDSQDSIDMNADDFVIVQSNSQNKPHLPKLTNVNSRDANVIFEPRDKRMSISSNNSSESANFTNECYESYEFSSSVNKKLINIPKPPPRPSAATPKVKDENTIYENVSMDSNKGRPVPAVRTHLPPKKSEEPEKPTLYENISILHERKIPDPPKRSNVPVPVKSNSIDASSLRSRVSSSSSSDSDSFIDETNLEDILLSEKSKSFRRSRDLEIYACRNDAVVRTQSNASDMTDITEASALENVDCSGDQLYLPMTGTLPTKNKETPEKKHILFRHKTFTNIEIDRNSYKVPEFPKWNNEFLKETLASYHIRGTGHCIYKAPTVTEFLNIFNRDTLNKPTQIPNDENFDAFETAVCFCKPKLNKNHSSAEDLLDVCPIDDQENVNIDLSALKNLEEMNRTSFRCFCDSKTCTFHSDRRESGNLIVKFSAVKKSISTPDITLDYSTVRPGGLIKNKSVPSNLEEPYAVVNLSDIIVRNNSAVKLDKSPIYTPMFPHGSLSSTSSSRLYSIKDIDEVISLNNNSTSTSARDSSASDTTSIHKSASEYSGHWSLQSCDSNVTIKSDATFVTCYEDSSDDSDGTLHSDEEISDAETIKSDVSTTKRPWVHSNSFNFGNKGPIFEKSVITEETSYDSSSSKIESGISVKGSESSFSDCEEGVPRVDGDVSLGASLERGSGVVGDVRSGSGRRRWDEAEGTSEGDALSVSSAASSCAPLHLAHHHEYSKVSPTPPKKPPRRNLSVSPTHANSPSSGYSYELRPHARSQDDLDDIQGAKHYLKHGRSVDQYVDGKFSYAEYEDHPSPRIAPVPNPRPSLKNRTQPVAITAMYENVVIKEQNPRRKLRRNNFGPQNEGSDKMNDNRVRKYSNQERSSLESLLDDLSMNSPSDCERYDVHHKADIPLSPTHYDQPPTPDHPPPSARQAENSIHERIRPLSQLIMEVVEEIRIRKKSQGDITNS